MNLSILDGAAVRSSKKSKRRHAADPLLDCAFYFLCRSDDPVLVHDCFLQDLAKLLNGRGGLWCSSALHFRRGVEV
ncbi:MAG: hypothetical protein USCAAHI_00196 [Beijerinckiaceae bacterium]|nr:MAG: hypothetical protein USCAAHI_00196 [Beijerinckiaceae bacterium]